MDNNRTNVMNIGIKPSYVSQMQSQMPEAPIHVKIDSAMSE